MMATGAFKKLEDQLNCPICLDTYTDPKLLQCFHVYCRKCLVRLVDRDQQGQLIVSCPTCRQATPVPAGGVAGLQPAFHINHLLEILVEAKDAPAIVEKEVEREPTVSASQAAGDAVRCSEHGKEVELFCEDCGEMMCWKCAVKGGKHQNHDYLELSGAFEKYREDITSSLEPMEKQVVTIGEALAQLDAHCAEISNQQAAIEVDIHTSISRLQEILEVRKRELTHQLHQLTQAKLKELACQRDQLETTQAQLSSCLEFMRESIEMEGQGEVLKMKTSVTKQVKELNTLLQTTILTPSQEADMLLSFLPSMTTLCQHYGAMFSTSQPDPTKCHLVDSLTPRVAVMGVDSRALIEMVNLKGESYKESVKSLECELVSEITGSRVRGSIRRRGESQYEISYQPTDKGRHQLHIKISGQHIRGSPFSVAVRTSNEVLGLPVQSIGGVDAPWGVAIGKGGQMVVSDLDGYCVTVFSPAGERLMSFGSRGYGPGQFESPCGVTFDHHGNILVTDCENHRIQKFSAADGHFLGEVGSFGGKPLQFSYPRGISLSPTNQRQRTYIAEGNRIQVLNSDLTFCMTFGTEGSGCGQFISPCGVTCDSTGNVYVADSGNHRIQVFTALGQFLRMFGERELYFPDGVAVDTSGLVYVSEGRNHRISVFTSAGDLVTSLGGEGHGEGLFTRPCGLALSSNGSMLHVCDSGNKRLQVFQVLQHFFSPIFLYLHRHLNELFLKNELKINNLLPQHSKNVPQHSKIVVKQYRKRM